MQSLERLKDEHAVIEAVLDLLTQVVERIDKDQPVPAEFESWTVDFFRQFADQCHHGKEEEALFPLLEQRGIPREGGPVGVLLDEHVQGRECVRRMDEAAARQDHAAFGQAAAEYAALLRQHILKENNVLFEMAASRLSDEEDARLQEQFEQVERERGGHEAHERFEADIKRWQQSLGQ